MNRKTLKWLVQRRSNISYGFFSMSDTFTVIWSIVEASIMISAALKVWSGILEKDSWFLNQKSLNSDVNGKSNGVVSMLGIRLNQQLSVASMNDVTFKHIILCRKDFNFFFFLFSSRKKKMSLCYPFNLCFAKTNKVCLSHEPITLIHLHTESYGSIL